MSSNSSKTKASTEETQTKRTPDSPANNLNGAQKYFVKNKNTLTKEDEYRQIAGKLLACEFLVTHSHSVKRQHMFILLVCAVMKYISIKIYGNRGHFRIPIVRRFMLAFRLVVAI